MSFLEHLRQSSLSLVEDCVLRQDCVLHQDYVLLQDCVLLGQPSHVLC